MFRFKATGRMGSGIARCNIFLHILGAAKFLLSF